MNRRWFALMMLSVLVLAACSGGEQAVAQPATEEVAAAPAATSTATLIPPTATSKPPTATPELPTPTPEPATATPAPATPTLMPVNEIEDVPYIDDGTWEHTASITLPAVGEGPYPTVVIYHSGFFWYGDSEYLAAYDEVAAFFAGRGYAVVVPAYRLSETDPYPAAVEDAFCTVAWVHAEAAHYGFDVTRVASLGLGAGGNLAALVGSVDDPARFLENCPHALPEQPPVHAVVEFSGFVDLPGSFGLESPGGMETMVRDFIALYLGGSLEEAPERYAEASPITWIDGSEPPFAVIHNDSSMFFDVTAGARAFADVLVAQGVPVEVIGIRGRVTALWPYSKCMRAASNTPDAPVTLEEIGFPQAEAFLADLFGIGE